MSNYIDKHGRWHIKPVTEANPYPTNNAYIYSFYAQMMGLPVQFDLDIKKQILNTDVVPLTRHPGDNTPAISHDEYVGVAGLNKYCAQGVVFYGEHNYWQFCDQQDFTPTPFRKLVINDVLTDYEGLANDPEQNVRRAVIRYPKLWPIAFWHRPEHQYFYLRCAGRSPGIVRTLYFVGASIATIASQGTGNVMLGFKLLRLKKEANLAEKLVTFLFNRYGNFVDRCIDMFPSDHPITKEVINRYGESMYSGGSGI